MAGEASGRAMRTRQHAGVRVAALALAVVAGAAWAGEAAAPVGVTAATGPSLLTRLRTGFDASSFGRAGYVGAPPAGGAEAMPPVAADWLVSGFQLTGEDLYRINCRSCHGVGARGLGPDIPSVVARVTGAAQQAAGGDATGELSIRHRLLVGGQVMPAMAHLSNAEVEALLGYLSAVAGTGRGAATPAVAAPAARVGEHVAKAVCQICHDASPGRLRAPGDQALSALAEMTARYSARELVRKVRSEAAGVGPGHKPRLDYLRREELEAAYVYLIGFPPADGKR
jgi:mono/diheme cytochrome c family protein